MATEAKRDVDDSAGAGDGAVDAADVHASMPETTNGSEHKEAAGVNSARTSRDADGGTGAAATASGGIPSEAKTAQEVRADPMRSAGCCSKVLFSYMSRFITRGGKDGVTADDLWLCEPLDSTAVAQRFDREFAALPAAKRTLPRVLFKLYFLEVLRSFAFYFVRICCQISGPVLLRELVAYLETGADDKGAYWPWLLVFLVWIVPSLEGVMFQHAARVMYRVMGKVRMTLVTAIYAKALRLSLGGRTDSSAGEIVNLVSNDARRMLDYSLFINLTLGAPILITVGVTLLLNIVGVAGLVGVGLLLITFPVSGRLAKRQGALVRQKQQHTDARLKFSSEVLQGVRTLKVYGWSSSFIDRIMDARKAEVKFVRRYAFTGAVASFVTAVVPISIGLATIVVYAALGNELTAAVVFPSIALLLVIRLPMQFVPLGLAFFFELFVSLRRITRFLLLPDKEAFAPKPRSDDHGIEVRGATFEWPRGDVTQATARAPKAGATDSRDDAVETSSDEEKFVLSDIDLIVKPGQLIAVVGGVGSGKSALCEAVLSEMQRVKGSVDVYGRAAYVPQTPFILNATVRQNVTFGAGELNPKLYDETIKACCLEDDLKLLPGGHDAEIGERGITLSGGQKQRVNVARAVFAQPDVVILDDPLSAVDAHVGAAMFEQVVNGALKSAARLFVTNNPDHLAEADEVLVMQSGRIVARGTFASLMESSAEFRSVLEKEQRRRASSAAEADGLDPIGEDGVGEDGDVTAPVAPRTLSTDSRLRSSSGDGISPLARERSGSGTAAAAAHARSKVASPVAAGEQSAALRREYSRFKLPTSASPAGDGSRGADDADGGVSPTSPALSRSRSRSRSHAASIDVSGEDGKTMAEEKQAAGSVGLRVYGRYVASWGGPWSPVLLLLLFVAAQVALNSTEWWLTFWTSDGADGWEQSQYLRVYALIAAGAAALALGRGLLYVLFTTRAARVLHDNLVVGIVRSPMSWFDTVPTGRIMNRLSKDVDNLDRMLPEVARGAIELFFYTLGNSIVIAVASWYMVPIYAIAVYLFYRIQRSYLPVSRDMQRLESMAQSPLVAHLSESLDGAATIRAYRTEERFYAHHRRMLDGHASTHYIQMLCSQWMGVRQNLASISILGCLAFSLVMTRGSVDASLAGLALNYGLLGTLVLQFAITQMVLTESLMTSAQRVMEYADLPQEGTLVVQDNRPPKGWPSQGHVVISRLRMRYRPNLPLALRGLDLEVHPGEKVGVVGRTGAGKSSIIAALFRLVEAEAGSIVIDGVEVGKIGLDDLRRGRLAIIPQSPVLFSGTVRYNLDPFDEHPDEALWEALRLSGMDEVVATLADEVTENGDCYSQGQRQLLCLSRALLRKPKVLILDEATASVDPRTDALVQRTLRSEFAESSVICVAHRLLTLADYDRIVCMSEGRAVEQGTPLKLLQDEDGMLTGLVRATGEENEAQFREIAATAASKKQQRGSGRTTA